jgi:hypothetical protein
MHVSNSVLAKRALIHVRKSNNYRRAGDFYFAPNGTMIPVPGVPTINQMINVAHKLALNAHRRATGRSGPGPTKNMVKRALNNLTNNDLRTLPSLNNI